MAFVTKTWKDRLVEYAGRRKLKNVATGEEILMDVSRSEGTVNQAGDAFSAANMNNLEQRIKTEFDSVNSSFAYDENGIYGYRRKVDGADTVIPFKSSPFSKIAIGNITATTDGYITIKVDFEPDIIVGYGHPVNIPSVNGSFVYSPDDNFNYGAWNEVNPLAISNYSYSENTLRFRATYKNHAYQYTNWNYILMKK